MSERRKKRSKQTAEVFTPPPLAHKMLSKLPKEVWLKGKTFCDPACGNGNLLLLVLWRKIAVRGHKSASALQSIFGVDVMRDNVRECRLRLLKMVSLFEPISEEHVKAVFKNIVFLNRQKYPHGSLEYDFSFSNCPKKENVEEWLTAIKNGILNEVTLPVSEEDFGSHIVDLFEEPDDERA